MLSGHSCRLIQDQFWPPPDTSHALGTQKRGFLRTFMTFFVSVIVTTANFVVDMFVVDRPNLRPELWIHQQWFLEIGHHFSYDALPL